MSTTNTTKPGQVLIPNSRLGYPKLFQATSIQGDPTSKPRYGCQIYLPKSDTATKALLDAEIARVTKERFKGEKRKSKDLFISDGDGEDGDENTKGYWIISANRSETQGRPAVIDRGRKPIDSAEQQTVYAGCFCNFLVDIYAPKNWQKICAGLEVVQFVKDGEPFGGGRVDVEAVMPDLGDDDDV